jgi:hypothetical protein
MDKEDRKTDREDLLNTLKENAEKWISGDKPEPVVTSFSSVIMPMIRKVMPQMIARHLTGVQPMTGPSGMIYNMGSIFDTILTTHIGQVAVYGKEIDYYAVKIPYGYFDKHSVSADDIYQWCIDMYSNDIDDSRWYVRGSMTYLFRTEEDRNWFLLRWSS